MDLPKDKDGKEIPAFSLQGADHTFKGRLNDIFGNLESMEKKHEAYEKTRKISGQLKEDESLFKQEPELGIIDSSRQRSGDKRVSTEDLDYLGTRSQVKKVCTDNEHAEEGDNCTSSEDKEWAENTESPRPGHLQHQFQFISPRGLAPRIRQSRVPDFRKNPDRWTHYTLKDVDDISESSNKRAALTFLDEHRKLKEEKELQESEIEPEETFDTSVGACSKGVLSFSKRTKGNTDFEDKTLDKGVLSQDTTSAEVDVSTVSTNLNLESAVLDEDDPDETADSVSAKIPHGAKFKSRKGIKRNIRSRDEDD